MLPLFACAMPVIILFCGLVLDCGSLQLTKLQMQGAADAAALGAELESERGTGRWVAAGKQDAAINGFADGVNNTTVAVQVRSSAGVYATSNDAIQVTIMRRVPSTFMGLLYGGTVTVSAQAVAMIPPCLYAMGISPYGLVHAPLILQSTQVRGNCPMDVGGDASVDALSTLVANALNLTGAQGNSLLSGLLPTAPRYGAAAIPDPLAAVASPSFSGVCNYTGFTRTLVSVTLSPGTYCGGITLTSTTATLSPGLYVITGGARWVGSAVRGTGVTLFFTRGGLFGYGQFILGGGTTMNLSAPADTSAGGIPAILVFGDRNWVATSAYDFLCVGSTVYGDGVWYTTGTGISTTACQMSAPNYLGIVTDVLSSTLFSNITLSSNYSNVPGGGPFDKVGGVVQ